MKRLFSTGTKVFTTALCLLLLSHMGLQACNMSDARCISVTGTGPYTITLELCIGMGVTGTTKGADDATKSVVFAFYDASPGFSITSFTPLTMVSPAPPQGTNPATCTLAGIITGPNVTLGSDMNVVYPMPNSAPCAGTSGTGYGCVSSTALCGQAISSCSTYTFVVNECPDSIRIFAVEGNGVLTNGCYMASDMRIVPCPTCLVTATDEGEAGGSNADVFAWETVGPNPFKDILKVGFYAAIPEAVEIRVADITGRNVARHTIQATDGSNHIRMDLGALADGQYFLTIQGSEGRLVRKLMKMQ